MADALFALLMAGAINPCTLRGAPIRHANLRVFMSRTVLEQRYAVRGPERANSSGRSSVNSAVAGCRVASPDPEPSDGVCVE
jgi:hypothetical protein